MYASNKGKILRFRWKIALNRPNTDYSLNTKYYHSKTNDAEPGVGEMVQAIS